MAQTTGGMSAANMYVGFSTDNASWTDVSGSANMVTPSGGERNTGTSTTFDGDTVILKAGKRGSIMVDIQGIYTEIATEFYTLAKTSYESGGTFYVRWSPGGGDAGDLGFTTSAGVVKTPPYPGGSSDDGGPIMQTVQVECAYVTQSTIGTAGW